MNISNSVWNYYQILKTHLQRFTICSTADMENWNDMWRKLLSIFQPPCSKLFLFLFFPSICSSPDYAFYSYIM